MPASESTRQRGTDTQPNGDGTAVLADEFRVPLHNYFRRRLRGQHDAEDLVQEVFVRLVNRSNVAELQAGRTVEEVRGYVFETANSVLVDWIRNRAFRQADAHVAFDADVHSGAEFSTERVVIAREELDALRKLLMELPVRQRRIFVLRQMEGMRYNDIAQYMGITVSGVEKHMRKALAYLAAGREEQ